MAPGAARDRATDRRVSSGRCRQGLAAAALAGVLLATGAPTAGAAEPFGFVALGDQPYGHEARTGPAYRRLIELINAEGLPFAIHVGDLKDGLTDCTDELYDRQYAYFQSYSSALVYTPGDNDWTDCRRQSADPLERLAALRARFFSTRASLGQRPLATERQSESQPAHARHTENRRWWHGGVLFVTFHTVGPDDNDDAQAPAERAERAGRLAANVAWLQDSFALARRQRAAALVLATQADPLHRPDQPGGAARVRKPFRALYDGTVLPLVRSAGVPVLLVHGDSHHFITDQPFMGIDGKRLPNLWRLEVPGERRMHAVAVQVDPRAPSPFRFRLIWNPMSPDPS